MKSTGTAIVFGGSGFLGSHVSDALSDSGYKVKIFDLQKSLYLKDDQEMILGNIMDLNKVCEAVKGCDIVYNFAGIADIDEAHHKPMETAKLNVMGTIHTLEAARLANVKRYVFASTIYVYSDKATFYRASKQSAERFVEVYSDNYDLDYTILRYGSLYGRRADKRNGIYRLLSQALREKVVSYPGSGRELREYIHVSDAANASVKILKDGFKNQHTILTGSEKMRTRDLLGMIAEILGGNVECKFGGEEIEGHYAITPYSFNPKIGRKLVITNHIDIGQGLLDCLAELHQKMELEYHSEQDWLVKDD